MKPNKLVSLTSYVNVFIFYDVSTNVFYSKYFYFILTIGLFFYLGYVGKGMLSGSIAGSLFASPSVSSIFAAIITVRSEGKYFEFQLYYIYSFNYL